MSSAPKNEARDQMLARIREHLSVRGDEPGRRGLVQSRLRSPKRNLIPERADKPKAELIKLFQSMLEISGAKVQRIRSAKALPEAIAGALREKNLPFRVRAGTAKVFDGLRAEPGLLEILDGPSDGADASGLSHAFGAAAETGTLFLLSGADNPSTLNFLPETHFVVIFADDILGSYEENWTRIRAVFGPGRMPRTVNLISGPSRTADIEQTIVMGAHGPKALHVFVAGS